MYFQRFMRWAPNEKPFHFLTPSNTGTIAAWYIFRTLSIETAPINMTFSPPASVTLPPLVATYVEATNSFDLEGLIATFVDDALVNDQLRDYWGKTAIREWAERDIIGERMTLEVTNVIEHHGNFIITAKVDGNFYKGGSRILWSWPSTSPWTKTGSLS